MEDLVKQQCEACRKGAPTITKEEIATLMPGLPEWKIVERGDLKPLERTFQLGNFARALSFTQMVGELAESQGHHPALLTEWGSYHRDVVDKENRWSASQ